MNPANPAPEAPLSQALDAANAALAHEADVLAGLWEQVSDTLPAAVALLAETRGRVLVSGLGKSGHIGAKIAATLASTGTPAQFIHAAEALHGDAGMAVPGDTAILISNSGRTAEVCRFGRMLKRRGIKLVSLTGVPTSPLARLADVHVDVGVEREADPLNLAPTASTTATLALGDALAAALMVVHGTTPERFHLFHPGGSLGEDLGEERS